MILPQLNTNLEYGIPIPEILGLDLTDSGIAIKDNYMIIDSSPKLNKHKMREIAK